MKRRSFIQSALAAVALPWLPKTKAVPIQAADPAELYSAVGEFDGYDDDGDEVSSTTGSADSSSSSVPSSVCVCSTSAWSYQQRSLPRSPDF